MTCPMTRMNLYNQICAAVWREFLHMCSSLIRDFLCLAHGQGMCYFFFIGRFPVILTITDISKFNFSKAVWWKFLQNSHKRSPQYILFECQFTTFYCLNSGRSSRSYEIETCSDYAINIIDDFFCSA